MVYGRDTLQIDENVNSSLVQFATLVVSLVDDGVIEGFCASQNAYNGILFFTVRVVKGRFFLNYGFYYTYSRAKADEVPHVISVQGTPVRM